MWKFLARSAMRAILRKKFFSLLSVSGLAVGLCIFSLALEFYNYETGFNSFHHQLANLYRLGISVPEGKTARTFPAIAPLIERSIPGVRKVIRFAEEFNDGAIISWQPPEKDADLRTFREEGCVFVDPAFPEAFDFPLVAGSNNLADPNTVVITASAARRLFGTAQPLGQTIRLHNQFGDLPVKVVGITADPPDQSDIKFRYLFSTRILENPHYTAGSDWAKLTAWGNDSYSTYIWLDPKIDPVTVSAAATRIWQHNDADYAHKHGSLFLQPLKDIHLGAGWTDDYPHYSSYLLTRAILALGILILVIAWINYINFATADALSKTRDIGVQKILGSEKWQIAARYIAESLILNLAALFLAFVALHFAQNLFNYITDRPLSSSYINKPGAWLMIFSILIAGSTICGGYTGLLLTRLRPVTALHFNAPGQPGHPGHSFLRKSLVVFQLSVSCIFTTLTLIAFYQVHYMKTQDLGMDIKNLVVIKGPAIRDSSFRSRSQLFRDKLSTLPFVEKFTASGSVPGVGSGHNFGSDGITGASPAGGDDKIEYSISEVDEHYFDTYRIPVVTGATFTTQDVSLGFSNDHLMVNETAARMLGYDPKKAVGRKVSWDKTYTIIGVAKDYHHRSLKEAIEPILYVGARNNGYYTISTDPAQLSSKMATVSRIYQDIYPGNSFSYTTLSDTFDHLYSGDQRTATLALTLSVLVILIAALGLIGLAAFTARRRTKEMGVRKVLGASTRGLFFLLSKEYISLMALSFLISTPLAWITGNKWLQHFPFRIDPGWQLFAAAGLICLLVTLLTISFQAGKTAFVNPAQQLRTD